METQEERVDRVTSEPIDIVPYDLEWPARFEQEKRHLLDCLPGDLIVRIEHFGSTAVPGLAAKPIVDMLVEVTDLQAVRERVVPVLDAQGYEYFWRPTSGDDVPPYYAWFIKRDPETGARTHHIHMVEPDFVEHWDRLLFRDYLIEHTDVASEYEALKRRLAAECEHDRVRYTQEKTDFIAAATARAKRDLLDGADRSAPNRRPRSSTRGVAMNEPSRLATVARALLAVDAVMWGVFGVLLLSGAVSMGDVNAGYVRLMGALMMLAAAVLGVLAWQVFRGRQAVDYAAVLVVAASVVAFVFDQIGWIDLGVMLLHVALLAVLIVAIRADRRARTAAAAKEV